MKTIVRPSFSAFFLSPASACASIRQSNLRCAPGLGPRVVAHSNSTAVGCAKRVRGVIYLEVLLDQVRNPWTRPQGSFVTQALGTLQEQLDQTGFVGFIQTRLPSRSPRPPQRNLAVFLIFPPPSADRLVARLQPTADLAVVQAFFEQLDRFEAALLKSYKVAPNASRIAHAGSDVAESN